MQRLKCISASIRVPFIVIQENRIELETEKPILSLPDNKFKPDEATRVSLTLKEGHVIGNYEAGYVKPNPPGSDFLVERSAAFAVLNQVKQEKQWTLGQTDLLFDLAKRMLWRENRVQEFDAAIQHVLAGQTPRSLALA